jgi:Tfp pilus assembly ATPase PilU
LSRALQGIVSQRLLPRAGGRGRVPAVEVLVVNSVAADALADGKFDRIETAMRDGEYYDMQTFDQSLLALYRRGLVDRDAALHHATSTPSLRVDLEQVDRERNGVAHPQGSHTAPFSAPPAPPLPSMAPPAVPALAPPGDPAATAGLPPLVAPGA